MIGEASKRYGLVSNSAKLYPPVPCGFDLRRLEGTYGAIPCPALLAVDSNLLHTVALHKGWGDAPPTTCFVFSEALHPYRCTHPYRCSTPLHFFDAHTSTPCHSFGEPSGIGCKGVCIKEV